MPRWTVRYRRGERKTKNRFVDDPGAGKQQQASLNKGGEIFNLAVAVLVIGIGGFVGDSNRKIGQQRSDQIEPGMRGLRENAQAAGGEANDNLEAGDDHCGQNGISRGRALLRAHHVRGRNGRTAGHAGIIAGQGRNAPSDCVTLRWVMTIDLEVHPRPIVKGRGQAGGRRTSEIAEAPMIQC